MQDDGPVTSYALLSASLVVFFSSGLLILWFHCRRAYPPIKARFWWQSEFISSVIILWSLHRCASLEFPGLGHAFYVLSYPLFFSICVAALIRLAHIYSAYKVAALYTEWKSSQNTLDIEAKISKAGFFVKYARSIQKPKIQAVVLLIHLLLQLTVWLAVAFAAEELTDQAETGLAGLILLLFGPPILYIAAKIIPLKDGLYLRQEIVFTFVACVVGAIIFVILRLVVSELIYVRIVVALVGPVEFVIIFIGFPLYKSYVWQNEARRFEMVAGRIASFESSYSQTGLSASSAQRVKGKPSKKKIEALEFAQKSKGGTSVVKLSLKQVLAHERGVEAFKEFCRQELNHESILFFLDVKEFCQAYKRSEMSEEQAISSAIHLYEKYVISGAQLEINIEYGLKQTFVDAGLGPASHVNTQDVKLDLVDNAFKEARDEVFRLMATDSFVRFLRHRLYADFVAKMVQESTARSLLYSKV